MSYRPSSAGHSAREAPRTVAQETLDDLVRIAEKWMRTPKLSSSESYQRAVKLTKDVHIGMMTAGVLALQSRLRTNERYCSLGIFISALWNCRCPEDTITYPHDTPDIDGLGYRLPERKTLIIQGNTNYWTGRDAKGTIIITGEAGDGIGWNATGLTIVTGRMRDLNRQNPAEPIIITNKAFCRSIFRTGHLTPASCEGSAALKNYVTRLLECAKNDPTAIGPEFGNGKRIVRNINKLVEWWK